MAKPRQAKKIRNLSNLNIAVIKVDLYQFQFKSDIGRVQDNCRNVKGNSPHYLRAGTWGSVVKKAFYG